MPNKPSRRRQNLIAGLLIAILLAGGAVLWMKTSSEVASGGEKSGAKGRSAGAGRTQPVAVAEVTQTDMPVWVQAIGTVVPRNLVTVRSRVDGELVKIAFKEGQMMKQGDLMAEIDPRAFQVQLTQASGQLARDQALLQNAQLDLQRYRELWSKDSIARQQLDTQEALVRQLQGTVEVDKGLVDNAKLQLSYTQIKAPISGRVGLRAVDAGNQIRSSDANGLASIAQLQPITAIFAVPESQLAAVSRRLGGTEPVAVEAWDREQKRLLSSGPLLTADNQIDPSTGTIKLKAEFANKDGALFPNQFVNIRIRLGTLNGALTVPVAAVQRGAKGSFVYVVNADLTIRIAGVLPGASDGKLIAVTGELQAGEKVVTDGTDKLRPGAKVEVVSAEARAAAMAPPGMRGDKKPEASTSETNTTVVASESKASATAEKAPAQPVTEKPSKTQAKPAEMSAAAATASTARPAWGEGEKPRWWDKVPPEVAEKLMKLSPEERREWLLKRREERERQAAGSQ